VGGMKEIIKNEVNGLLVSDNDELALADCIFRLYQNKSLLEALSFNARKTIEKNYEISQSINKLHEVYTTTIKEM
jgi:glycosyltransferase involved in cell wall biosynthesis